MSRVVFVNGEYLPYEESKVHIEDRGYQFADGVYEVFAVIENKLAAYDAHMTRLLRSLSELWCFLIACCHLYKIHLDSSPYKVGIDNCIIGTDFHGVDSGIHIEVA